MYQKKRNESVSPSVKKLFGGTLLAVVLCGTSFFVVRDYQEQKAYQSWARTQNKEVYDQSLTQRTQERLSQKEFQKENDSFYQRLHDDLPVRILVLGDAYGQGLGAEKKSSTWSSILESSLRKKYKVNVTVDNLSLSGASGAYSGFGLLSTLKNQAQGGKDYDLCILSFGTNDAPKDFSLWYEGILQNLREKYPHCSVMSILGHQGVMQPELGFLDENINVLKNLTQTYRGTLIDMPTAMFPDDHGKSNSDDNRPQYTNDGLFLNDAGQKLLADTIYHSIVATVAKYPDYNKDTITPVAPEVPALKDAVYVSADQFERIDQYTLTIGPSALKTAGIDTEHFIGTLGVDFSYIPGANDLLVSDAGRGLGRNAFSLEGKKAERTFAPINDHVKISEYLMLSFLTKSQADAFQGVLFTKDVPMSEALDAFTTPEQIGPVDETGALIPLDREGKWNMDGNPDNAMTNIEGTQNASTAQQSDDTTGKNSSNPSKTASRASVNSTSASTGGNGKTSASTSSHIAESGSNTQTVANSRSDHALNETLANSRPSESSSTETITTETTASAGYAASTYDGSENESATLVLEQSSTENHGENTDDSSNNASSTGSDANADTHPTLPDDSTHTSVNRPKLASGKHLVTTSSPDVKKSSS